MKKSFATLIFLAVSCSAFADVAAVISRTTAFHKLCVAAIPEAYSRDPGALGHIPAFRVHSLDGEIAILNAVRLQGERAKKREDVEAARYCAAFTLSSLDALEHAIDECVTMLKICRIAITDDITRSRTEALESIKVFRKELSADASETKG